MINTKRSEYIATFSKRLRPSLNACPHSGQSVKQTADNRRQHDPAAIKEGADSQMPVLVLAKPSSRTTGSGSALLMLNILSAVNCGFATWRSPAIKSLTPTAQNTNDSPTRGQIPVLLLNTNNPKSGSWRYTLGRPSTGTRVVYAGCRSGGGRSWRPRRYFIRA
jgi:hypothetical protein